MTETYKGYTIEIEQDDCSTNPRDWDNLGTMICFHTRYNLGDRHDLKSDDYKSWGEIKKYIEKEMDGYIILPLYLYDHSGITMNTTGYSCGYDSMQVGFIYTTAEKIRKEYSAKRISKKLKGRVTGYLVGEVKTYDQFLTGDVWGFKIFKGEKEIDLELENEVDSCWGFFGTDDCKKEAQSVVDHLVKETEDNKLVANMPIEDLPLFTSDTFKYQSSREIFLKRLQGVSMNTEFSYMYRDGDNYKQCESVIFAGEVTQKELEMILSNREESEFFIPSQVGLEDLQSRMSSFPDGSDHVWHELQISDIALIDTEPTESIDIHAFALKFKDKLGEWDVLKAAEELGIL